MENDYIFVIGCTGQTITYLKNIQIGFNQNFIIAHILVVNPECELQANILF